MSIVSHPANQKYRDNWDSIFKKKEERVNSPYTWVCRNCGWVFHTAYGYAGVPCFDCGAPMEEESE